MAVRAWRCQRRAKAGPGVYRRYDEALDHRTRHRMLLRHTMRAAIDHGQFELHCQPLVDLNSGEIVSAEALVRWRHPELGLLRPDLFIGLADPSGLIGPLGEWVMRSRHAADEKPGSSRSRSPSHRPQQFSDLLRRSESDLLTEPTYLATLAPSGSRGEPTITAHRARARLHRGD